MHISAKRRYIGTAVFGNKLYIYYGAADKRIAVVSVKLNDLIKAMK